MSRRELEKLGKRKEQSKLAKEEAREKNRKYLVNIENF